MAVYGGLAAPVAVMVNAALIAYLALFPAFFALIVRRLSLAYGRAALLAAPFVWVATELGRTYIITGFPWVLLGYSQVTVLPIAQFASLFGVYGVSALVAAMNTARLPPRRSPAPPTDRFPSGARKRELRQPPSSSNGGARRHRGSRLGESDGFRRTALTREGTPIRVGMVQGNVDQAEKMEQRARRRRSSRTT